MTFTVRLRLRVSKEGGSRRLGEEERMVSAGVGMGLFKSDLAGRLRRHGPGHNSWRLEWQASQNDGNTCARASMKYLGLGAVSKSNLADMPSLFHTSYQSPHFEYRCVFLWREFLRV
jgi:hypothetical protein